MKNKLLILISLIILCILSPKVYSNSEYTDLYQVKYKNQWLFLNEKGDVVIKIPASKFDDVGNFTEGRGFLAKEIKYIADDYYDANYTYKLVKLAIIDSNNNIIKKFETPVFIIDDDGESNGSYIPEFYKGYARITFVENKNIGKVKKYTQLKLKDKYVDINGNFTDENSIPKDIKSMLDDELIARNRYEYNPNLIPKETICTYNKGLNCFSYVDKNGRVIISPVWDSVFTCCGDWFAPNPYFYNDRAVAFIPKGEQPYLDGFYVFINTEGKPINSSGYSYVEPFYRKITMVMFKDGERAYINTSGEVVWNDKIQEQRDKLQL